jgi:hypothetical protein
MNAQLPAFNTQLPRGRNTDAARYLNDPPSLPDKLQRTGRHRALQFGGEETPKKHAFCETNPPVNYGICRYLGGRLSESGRVPEGLGVKDRCR